MPLAASSIKGKPAQLASLSQSISSTSASQSALSRNMAQSTVSTELLLEQITAVRNGSNVLPARQDDEGEVPKAVR